MNPLSQPVLALNSSFDLSSFTMSSCITIAFFIMSFLDTCRPLLHLSWIHSKTDSFSLSLRSFLPAPSIRSFFCLFLLISHYLQFFQSFLFSLAIFLFFSDQLWAFFLRLYFHGSVRKKEH